MTPFEIVITVVGSIYYVMAWRRYFASLIERYTPPADPYTRPIKTWGEFWDSVFKATFRTPFLMVVYPFVVGYAVVEHVGYAVVEQVGRRLINRIKTPDVLQDPYAFARIFAWKSRVEKKQMRGRGGR